MVGDVDFVSIAADGTSDTVNVNGCFKVQYAHPKEVTVVKTGWMFAAVIFAPLIAIIAAVLTFRFCCKRYWYQELTDEEEQLARREQEKSFVHKVAWKTAPFHMQRKLRKTTRGCQAAIGEDFDVAYGRLIEPDRLSVTDLHKQSSTDRSTGRNNSITNTHYHFNTTKKNGPKVHYGLADLIIEPSTSSSNRNEDRAKFTESLEEELFNNRNKLSEAVLRSQLNKVNRYAKADRKILDNLVEDFMAGIEQDDQAMQFEMHMQLQELADDGQPLTEERKRQIQAEFRQRRHMIFKESLDNLRTALKDETNLSDSQIDELCSELSKSLTELERILSDSLDQKIEFYYKQQLERDNVAQLIDTQKNEARHLTQSHEKIIDRMVNDEPLNVLPAAEKRKLTEKLTQELKAETETHKNELENELRTERERLKKRRTEKLNKLADKHENEMRKVMEKSKQTSDAVQTLENINELVAVHTDQQLKVNKQLDREEAERIKEIHQAANQRLAERLGQSIAMQTSEWGKQLNSDDLQLLKHNMKKQMEKLEGQRSVMRKEEEKAAVKALDEQKKKVENLLAEHEAALNQINETNNTVIERVATAQPLFDDRDKERLLVENEHNRRLLESLFRLARLQCDQSLRKKIDERRKKYAEQTQNSGQLDMYLDRDFDREKEELEEEQERLISEMREGMSKETQDLLEAQQSRMAHVIGTLQVGHARRQAAIERQMQMVSRLERLRKRELEVRNKAKEKETVVNHDKLTDLLQNHKEQVTKLQKTLDETRQRQLNTLQQRYNRIRSEKESSVNTQYDNVSDMMSDDTNLIKPTALDKTVRNSVLSAGRERALRDVQLRADAHFAREKDKLNLEMQRELEEVLLEQKQQFLDHLASLINLSSEELRARSRAASQNRLGSTSQRESSQPKLPPLKLTSSRVGPDPDSSLNSSLDGYDETSITKMFDSSPRQSTRASRKRRKR